LESNIEKAEEEMGKYYQLKEEFLKVFTTNLIHKQFIGEKKKRVYSYEKNYEKLLKEKIMIFFGKIVTMITIKIWRSSFLIII